MNNSVPEIWRTEVWHPLSVHFPIVLLSFASILFLVTFFLREQNRSQWRLFASALLYVGTITAWIAIYTGNLADGIVARKICDPTVLKTHENTAYIMTYLFTAAAVLDFSLHFSLLKKWVRLLRIIGLLVLLVGLGYVTYVGHLGASLVYQQGAGVYHPTEDCREFE